MVGPPPPPPKNIFPHGIYKLFEKRKQMAHQTKKYNINHEDSRRPKKGEKGVDTYDRDFMNMLSFGLGLERQIRKANGQLSCQEVTEQKQ